MKIFRLLILILLLLFSPGCKENDPFETAIVQYQEGKLDEALTSVNAALQVDSNNFRALALKAAISLQKEAFEDAVKDSSAAKEGKTDEAGWEKIPDPSVTLATAYLRKGDYAEALQEYLNSSDPSSLNWSTEDLRKIFDKAKGIGNHEAVITLADVILKDDPKNLNLLKSQAKSAEELKKFEVMVKARRQIVEISPDDASNQNGLAWALDLNGEYDEAIKHAELSLQKKPGWAYALDTLAFAKVGKGQYEEAIEIYQQAIADKPLSESYYGLAEAYNKLGKTEESKKAMERAKQMNPRMELVWK